jgi:predicted Fe-S protein YdhL (DUF1289 family)
MTARDLIDGLSRRRVESPCINVCAIDPDSDYCQGCFRLLAEIAAWGTSSAQRRKQILDSVESRRTERGQK